MSKRREKRRIAEGGIPPGAVPADASKLQHAGQRGRLKKFYFDIPFKCRDCRSDEVWTGEQQKWFYEVAKVSLHAVVNRCRECRKRRKEANNKPSEKPIPPNH